MAWRAEPRLAAWQIPALHHFPLPVATQILGKWQIDRRGLTLHDFSLDLKDQRWRSTRGPLAFSFPLVGLAGHKADVVLSPFLSFEQALAAVATALGEPVFPRCWKLCFGTERLLHCSWPTLLFGSAWLPTALPLGATAHLACPSLEVRPAASGWDMPPRPSHTPQHWSTQ